VKIRSKLTYLFVIIVGSLLIIFSIYIYYFSAEYREQEFYARLKEKAITTAKLLIGPNQIDQNLLKALDRKDLTVLHSEEIMIFNHLDEEIYDSGSDTIPITKEFLNHVRTHGESKVKSGKTEIIGVLYKDNLNKYVVVTSALDTYGFSKQKNLLIILVVGCISGIAIVFFAGWYFSFKALKPMSDIVEQVDKITGTDLSKRVVSANNKDEIAHLTSTFNNMLARVEKAFDAQKSFVSNASHELRTPLTSITGQIEVVLLKERDKEEYKAVLNSVLEDIKGITDLSNALLELAKVTGDATVSHWETVRIDELLWEVKENIIKRKPEYKVEIHLSEIPEDESMLSLKGFQKLLFVAFYNLIENGCKFSSEKRVRVSLEVRPEDIEIKFEDKGIGIDPKDLLTVFEPFYRASNATNIHGHGVGLSMTKKIIELHRGNIQIHSVLQEGTTISVRFRQEI
jgi:two-component system, OmpR family, sensor histidine kinase ArlS